MALLDNFWGKKRFQSLFERLYKLSLRGMNYGRASDYVNNGESVLLEKLTGMIVSKSPVFFDVGANKGEFTKHLLESWKGRDMTVYAFEPSVKTYEMLRQAVPSGSSVHLINKGLGEKSEKVQLYFDRIGSGLASVYPRDLSYHNIEFSNSETIELTTLDSFCDSNGIAFIDFLKLDVEGHELSVLKGGSRMLGSGKIGMIQFEFGGCNIDSRSFFRDYYNFFKIDYDLYRIMSDGLHPIRNYSERLEVFISANYLAIRK